METPFLSGSSNSFTVRLSLDNQTGVLAKALDTIGQHGGHIGAIDIVRSDQLKMIRDITFYSPDKLEINNILDHLRNLDGITVVRCADRTFLLHLRGKIEIRSKTPIKTRSQLSMAYTPGVARVCKAIHNDPSSAYGLTIKGNMVAVVTDGTAVLGLGDIGPEAAMPVMEGKAQLFKEFGGVDAFPICLRTKDTDEIVKTIKYMEPTFGGINLEDIAAPRCFEIERRLKAELSIPVFHDDQHGTAVVTTAALINALKVVEKQANELKTVIIGVGAAGTAVTRMLLNLGCENVIGLDSKGALSSVRTDLNDEKKHFRKYTNPNDEHGTLDDVIDGADVFIGLSAPDVLTVEHLKKMAKKPIVFAMANPDPEIKPELAWPHVAVMATGRSDYPNQINNVLCFPGIFKGALSCRARDINEEMKFAAAKAIADTIADDINADYIIPSVFDQRVAPSVAEAVRLAAIETGVARKS